MRFVVLLATLLLAACGLPGTGPGEWKTMPAVKQAQVENENRGTRPPLPDPPSRSSLAARTIAAAEETGAERTAAAAEQAAAQAPAERREAASEPAPAKVARASPAPSATPAVPPRVAAVEPSAAAPAASDSNVEALSKVTLKDAQARAVQAGLRQAWRDDSAQLQRIAAGRNALGVVFVCGYADRLTSGNRQSHAFRGVLMGADRAQPRFVPVGGSSPATDEQTTAGQCLEQGIPLASAEAVSIGPAEPAPEPTAEAAVPVAAVNPPPRVPLSEPHINAVKAGVTASLKADAPVFGRMLAAADAKGGIVVCGYVSAGGSAPQPFTGVLIGEGESRRFVPVGFGRNPSEQSETMQVCSRQGIPL